MDQVIALLLTYRYLLMFPLAIFEGPIITVLGGFLASSGIFNPFLVYLVALAGDFVGDTFLYELGRHGGKLLHGRVGKFMGVTPEKMEIAKEKFKVHHKKTIILSKILHGIGVTGLTAAGTLKVPYSRYIFLCMLTAAIQSAILLSVGFLFGHMYLQLNKYMDYFAATTIFIGLSVIIILIIRKKFFKKKS